MKAFLLLTSLALVASAKIDSQNENKMRYIVFPGLDASASEVAEWKTGWASLFNVFFGPKPYVFGWVGEGGSFATKDPDPDISDSDPDDEDDDDPEGIYRETKNH